MKNKEENMTYEETLEYIHTVNWQFCKPGLERIRELCKGLKNPEKSLKFIHVAGTNGKGSFCSMLSTVLTKAGYKTGLYTSPYIKCFNERMAINGEMISNDELVEITKKVKIVADKMEDKPTEFELVTAIALEYFKRNKCDYVVFECGLGGRLDSTNIVENVELSVITGISLDHTSILGNTISEIAKEKAGIIKDNIPCLWCGNNKEAKNVIEQTAKYRHSPLCFSDHSEIKIKETSLNGTTLDYKDFKNIKINLLGVYQPLNCANVLEAITILRKNGLKIDDKAVYDGMSSAAWHARFERILDTPLVIFDGAHNPEGVLASVDSIKHYFGDKKVYVLTGVMKDKDYSFMARKISEASKKVFTITPDNPRALDAGEYCEVYKSLGIETYSFSCVEDGLTFALREAQKDGYALFCLGSLYMYSQITDIIEKSFSI